MASPAPQTAAQPAGAAGQQAAHRATAQYATAEPALQPGQRDSDDEAGFQRQGGRGWRGDQAQCGAPGPGDAGLGEPGGEPPDPPPAWAADRSPRPAPTPARP